ncbi:hypothetical protein AAT19DRAFT_10448 [Rhodotorula toruloides]|uniref:Uncharacterized protein n=1 Tax=Rhodotorula toruloides TaxID=5286 RepID=A0A2S9ZYR8_RHOTO|nr:hypothetical protein AAT19DRAFT_10448 [Rhodotorula toruloides]
MSSVRGRVNWLERASGLFECEEVSARMEDWTARVRTGYDSPSPRSPWEPARAGETSERGGCFAASCGVRQVGVRACVGSARSSSVKSKSEQEGEGARCECGPMSEVRVNTSASAAQVAGRAVQGCRGCACVREAQLARAQLSVVSERGERVSE